jgi:hypothetical protein
MLVYLCGSPIPSPLCDLAGQTMKITPFGRLIADRIGQEKAHTHTHTCGRHGSCGWRRLRNRTLGTHATLTNPLFSLQRLPFALSVSGATLLIPLLLSYAPTKRRLVSHQGQERCTR